MDSKKIEFFSASRVLKKFVKDLGFKILDLKCYFTKKSVKFSAEYFLMQS